MFGLRRPLFTAVIGAVALLSTGCYYIQADLAEKNADPVPWFCNPTVPNSVTGPGMGSVNFYAGVTRQALDYTTCKEVALQFDQAKTYAKQYPTLGDAQAAGFKNTFDFIPGMGTHTGRDTITPAMLADPNFDKLNPIIPNSAIDDVFDPAHPEFLQYNGNTPGSVLIGMSYYVRTTTGLPPEGFAGSNDWWHHHPTLCFNPTTAVAFGANTTDAGCAASGGVNVHLQNYYMLHIWVVDGIEYLGDIHAPMHPCIVGTGAIFDMNDPCHHSAMPMGAMSAAGG